MSRLKIEASSACQLRCPLCPTTTGHTDAAIGKGFLRLSDFAKLADANPWLAEIELSNYGEPFLNPELPDILRHGFERNIDLTIRNGTNLNHARDDALEAVVRYQVRVVNCSIDGASQQTYSIYRVGGRFDRVMENLRKLNELKAAYRSPYPRLHWQFVAFGHNEHEIETARSLARELNMSFGVKLSWDSSYSPVRDKPLVRGASGTGSATREEFREKSGHDYLAGICEDLWDSPQINWDGKVLGCCRNFWGDFGGNAFREGLAPSLEHERLRYAQEMLTGRKPPRADVPCSTCELYLRRRGRGDWMKKPSRQAGPEAAEAALRLAGSERAAGHLEEAAGHARRALRQKPGDTAALEVLGLTAHRAGRLEAARHYLQASIAADPQSTLPQEALAVVMRDVAACGGNELPLFPVPDVWREHELRLERDQLAGELARIRGSRSWRVTAPLRALACKLGALKRRAARLLSG